MAKKRKKTKKKKRALLIVILFLLALGVGGYCLYDAGYLKKEIDQITKTKPKPKPKLQIVNEDSKTRPVAVMINNNHAAWPHAGLQDAYLTYEILAEGGITRLMAIFKDKNTEKIGSVRSARPYYLDYALENDAIYVHFGWSEDARRDISSLGIDNINGLTASSVFWRDTTLGKAQEHTAFTKMDKINMYTKEKGYDRDTNTKLLLNYSIKSVDLSKMEGAKKADKVFMKYSNYHNTSYEYDSENKVYKRAMSGTAHNDAITGNQYTAKNIIITPIKNYSYDSYGRQKLENIGSGNGYYITNGYAVPITYTKASRSSQTIYRYMDGEEIKVNDGNTYIQITPVNETLTIEGEEIAES